MIDEADADELSERAQERRRKRNGNAPYRLRHARRLMKRFRHAADEMGRIEVIGYYDATILGLADTG